MQYLALLDARWRGLAPSARVALSALVAVAGIACAVAALAARAPRETLFAAPLHAEQLSEVEERLAAWGVAFTPTADNVVVSTGRRNDLLLRLAMAGVPHEHLETTGEALAGVGALTPQAVIDAQTRAGLAGDIEAGLRGIDGVDDARVLVAPAKPAEFADESSREASASVRLRTRGGAPLPDATVAGIRAFVAGAVPGLAPSNVTILDDTGAALGDRQRPGDANALQRSLQGALDAAYGEGTSIVRVRVEYRGDRVAQRDVRRTPAGLEPIVRAARSERYDDGAKRYRRDEQNDDRGSDTREFVSETEPGEIRRVSTAVLVDSAAAVRVAEVREVAAATVGYDARRGDTLAVTAVDFHRAAVPRKDVWWLLYGAIVPLLPAVALGVALVVTARTAVPATIAAARPLLERAAIARTAKDVSGLEPQRVRNALSHEPPYAAAAVISALPAATAAAVLDLYPAHERQAIVARMQRPQTPFLADAQEFLRRHA
ncbi:MAG TPA: flagellar M-ring protein FliF C-terminal domain-containing protein [Candidatus Acidoferrales bacterium]|nr:flagellar M-ring protein FliF C-terminal domain-containing protein [Candidatus Acidoferrales bacterium]